MDTTADPSLRSTPPRGAAGAPPGPDEAPADALTLVPRDALRGFFGLPLRLLLALAMTAVVSVIVLGVSEITASRVREIRVQAERVHEIAANIAAIREALGHAESAQRGYLLMQDRRYLEPFNEAMARAQKSFVDLSALTQGDKVASERSRALVAVATSKLDEMRLTVSNEEQGRHEQAMNLLRAGYGVQMMEDLVKQANAFETEQLGVLADRQRAIDHSLVQQRIGVGLVVFINLAFLAVLANMMMRQFQLRERHRQELEAQAALLERQVAARTEELSSLSSYLQATTERDKSRLARDLHDELGGILTSAKIDIAWLEGHSKSTDPEVVPRLQRLSETVDEAVHVKRRVVEDLRPSLLDHLGLGAALDWYVRETCSKAGLQCNFRSLPEGEQVPPEVAIAIYRTVQEGLTNTLKHAQATAIDISLERQRNGYKLKLSDNGAGISDFRADKLSHGIAGMRQRARALGGRFALRTAPREGTTIEAYFPLPRET
jgi:signal transduction histidine kinase